MLNRTQRAIIAAALAAVALLPIAAFIFLSKDDGGDASVRRGCSAEDVAIEATLTARPTPTPIGPNIDHEEFNRIGQENVSRPFIGMLCGFEIVATEDEARPSNYCRGTVSGRDQSHSQQQFLPSELNKPGLREQGVCDGSEVFATYGTVRRSYFRDTPKVHFVGNREILRYTQVDGHDVLMRLFPMPMWPVFVAAVQRWPEGDRPGILIALVAGDANDASAQVRRALAE